MTQEFYRGGTRSPFSTRVNTGAWATDGTGLAAIPVATALSGSQLRIKRVQAGLMLPKQSNNKSGWWAFVRVPNDFTAQYADLDPSDPTVLRAKGMMTNQDHATYWENYLEAINLDSGGLLVLLVNLDGAITTPAPAFSIRWTEERALG